MLKKMLYSCPEKINPTNPFYFLNISCMSSSILYKIKLNAYIKL